MARVLLPGYRGAGLGLTAVVLLAMPARGAQESPRDVAASIETVVTFSSLDGGGSDLDGVANGVLTLADLELHEGGTIILDVASAEFDVSGGVTLRGHSAIRVPYDDPPEFGPQVRIQCGGALSVRGTARVSVNGASGGGRLIVCAAGGIELKGDARVTADGVGPDAGGLADGSERSTPFETAGGDVWMQSPGRIRILESARISVNGTDGGSVRLIACSDSAAAIEIDGTIRSLGEGGVGGPVEVEARQGGILFDDGDILVEGGGLLVHPPAIVTKGSEGDGPITITAATKVDPNPPPTFPAAIVTENSPSTADCDSCFHEDPNDCDDDGVPNAAEIAACDGDPSCDDCNLNGVPDECDIAFGESVDVDPHDGVPDECFGFIAGGCSPPSENWSCFDNWALPGDLYPDDLSSAVNVHVTLGGGDFAFLDVSAQIPTLRLLYGAILRVTQDGSIGDLDFSSPAKVLNLGAILVYGDREIGGGGLPPLFTLGPGGLYAKNPTVTARAGVGSFNRAGLTVSDLVLEAGRCTSPPASGGILELDDAMSLSAVGNIYVRGSDVANCNAQDGEVIARGGVSPPPKLNISGGSASRIGVKTLARSGSEAVAAAPTGNLHLERIVEVSVRSSEPLVLLGDFDNRSTAPDRFDWLYGGVSLKGVVPQVFEVAGRDVGPSFAGIFPQEDSNFAMGKVHVGAGADVSFANAFANTVGARPCDEALYVRELVLEPGAQITLDNCRVYYAFGSTSSAVVNTVGCGALVQMVPPAPRVGDDVCIGGTNAAHPCGQHAECPGGSCLLKNRFASFVPALPPIGDPIPMGIKITAVNLAASSVSSPAALAGQSWWVQSPTMDIADGVSPAFDAASLACSFVAIDLSANSLLHAYGPAVVPGSAYEVQICTTVDGPCSAPLRVDTATWGDVTPPLVSGQPTFQDIMAVVNKFLGNPSGPSKTRTKLSGLSPDPLAPVNFHEVSTAVDAFKGHAFVTQFPVGPTTCP